MDSIRDWITDNHVHCQDCSDEPYVWRPKQLPERNRFSGHVHHGLLRPGGRNPLHYSILCNGVQRNHLRLDVQEEDKGEVR